MEKGGKDKTKMDVEKDLQTESEESEDDEQTNQTESVKKRTRKSKDQAHGVDEDDTGEESDESIKYKQGKKLKSDDISGTEKIQRRPHTMKNGKKRSRNTSNEKNPSTQGYEDEAKTNGKRENTHKRDSSDTSEDDNEEEDKLSTVREKDELVEESDSSSLTSLEDVEDRERSKTQERRKAVGKKSTEDDKAVVKLKRYIALCGVRRNYKKLLDGSRSIRAKVAILRKELEILGVKGQPTIMKCKKARLKREESQELAELDINNIITTQGRPKRRGATAWHVSTSSSYKRMLNSSSDSDENNQTSRGHKQTTNWDKLQGIISDDGDSN